MIQKFKRIRLLLIAGAGYMLPIAYQAVIKALQIDVWKHWIPVAIGLSVVITIGMWIFFTCAAALEKQYEKAVVAGIRRARQYGNG